MIVAGYNLVAKMDALKAALASIEEGVASHVEAVGTDENEELEAIQQKYIEHQMAFHASASAHGTHPTVGNPHLKEEMASFAPMREAAGIVKGVRAFLDQVDGALDDLTARAKEMAAVVKAA